MLLRCRRWAVLRPAAVLPARHPPTAVLAVTPTVTAVRTAAHDHPTVLKKSTPSATARFALLRIWRRRTMGRRKSKATTGMWMTRLVFFQREMRRRMGIEIQAVRGRRVARRRGAFLEVASEVSWSFGSVTSSWAWEVVHCLFTVARSFVVCSLFLSGFGIAVVLACAVLFDRATRP